VGECEAERLAEIDTAGKEDKKKNLYTQKEAHPQAVKKGSGRRSRGVTV